MKTKPLDLDKVIERYDVLTACISGALAALEEQSNPGDLTERIVCGLQTARHEFDQAITPLFKNGGAA